MKAKFGNSSSDGDNKACGMLLNTCLDHVTPVKHHMWLDYLFGG